MLGLIFSMLGCRLWFLVLLAIVYVEGGCNMTGNFFEMRDKGFGNFFEGGRGIGDLGISLKADGGTGQGGHKSCPVPPGFDENFMFLA